MRSLRGEVREMLHDLDRADDQVTKALQDLKKSKEVLLEAQQKEQLVKQEVDRARQTYDETDDMMMDAQDADDIAHDMLFEDPYTDDEVKKAHQFYLEMMKVNQMHEESKLLLNQANIAWIATWDEMKYAQKEVLKAEKYVQHTNTRKKYMWLHLMWYRTDEQ